MKRFNWSSRQSVTDLMRYYNRKFAQWSEVRLLSSEELELWVSLDCYLNFPFGSDYVSVRDSLRNFLES